MHNKDRRAHGERDMVHQVQPNGLGITRRRKSAAAGDAVLGGRGVHLSLA
jgi:hypothetical protein